ncbi:threonylcarbamoyl-AMP synthase [Phycicoccus sp. BSK3Z-2]|uniref:L-threonylcarbamoyladenylate synthase n=1 Tax=Phycicoccus avicenniae TaxID=2828860 RepID=A0A941DAB5_9MICO|nr:L-threonylcarbamoyladenylate synthase [Phycicoccus avicenniae]MBR7743730.1 threonylcarbamoyl-AMP synthase [Phycicoccus avicenniae]
MSPVFDCTTEAGRSEAVTKTAEGVRRGALVVLPTDTVYGIGADAFDGEAVKALLAAKGRGPDMPPPVLVPEARTIDGLATQVPAYARALVEEFWPGPLTLVLQAQPSLVWDLGETGGTVALRMPDDEVALEVLRAVGPMAVSSANRHGYPSSRTVLDAASQLGAAVEFYLDGGPSTGGLASTIVDCTRDEPVVLRLGALSEEDVMAVVERSRADALQLSDADDGPADDDPAAETDDGTRAAADDAAADSQTDAGTQTDAQTDSGAETDAPTQDEPRETSTDE